MNNGFDLSVISEFVSKSKLAQAVFLPVDENDNSDEYFHFQFLGNYEGKPVIYDAVLTTLRLEHVPHWNKADFDKDEEGGSAESDRLREEIGMYMAEVILELQDEGAIKVKEHIEIELDPDFGVRLDGALQVDKVTAAVVERFIEQFNSDKLFLDDTLYSFQADEGE